MRKAGDLTVALAGNPNCGKTTLFNALSGENRKVANWPGVTVEKVEGWLEYGGRGIRLVDLPGIYSLDCYTLEEQVARRGLMEEGVDVIVNVTDASCLERSLYLTTQLLDLQKPVVLALNMMDLVEKRGIRIDRLKLSRQLGNIPVIPVSARRRSGLTDLLEAVRAAKETADVCLHSANADARYDYIEQIVKQCVSGQQEREIFTDRLDRVLTHRILGIPVFLALMAAVFFCTFTVGDFLKGYLEAGLAFASAWLTGFLTAMHTAPWLVSMITDGILAGVGGILTFLPNLAILFLALALLEDSGYMARVAYIMDPVMRPMGLSGKAFLPLVLGFGCTVPAVLAARTLERETDRRRTILMAPFMSCSARLPIYILFSQMFFPEHAMLTAYSLYLWGMAAALAAAFLSRKRNREQEPPPLLIELPEYRRPDARTVLIYVKEKTGDYLTKAGTTIFLASVALWLLIHNNQYGMAAQIGDSFAARIGRTIAPIFAPAGFDIWQLSVALIGGLSAKEVVVSSLAVLYGLGDLQTAQGMSRLAGLLAADGLNRAGAYAFLIFCLLYCPCAAAVAAVHRETGSWRWTLKMVLFQILFAWTAAVAVYQVGCLLFT